MRLILSKKKRNEFSAVRISDFRFPSHCGADAWLVVSLIILFALITIKGQEKAENSKSNDSSSSPVDSTMLRKFPPKLISETVYPKFEISERDLSATIDYFKTEDSKAAVENFKAKMPAVVTDTQTRNGIIRQLPVAVTKLKIEDSGIIEKLAKVIKSVLNLYGRDKVYEIIVFRHSTPIIFSDTGVVLVISTGMIERVNSDDELLGYTAHENCTRIFSRLFNLLATPVKNYF